MFVGAGGVGRIVSRTAELMKVHDTDDVAPHGGINLDTLQRYLNEHFTVSLDLFGAETSTNAANYFASGLKGRFNEGNHDDDHRLGDDTVTFACLTHGHPEGDRIGSRQVAALSALNATLRSDYVEDCQKGVDRWNRTLAEAGATELFLPHIGFHRQVGEFAGAPITPGGRLVSGDDWKAQRHQWLPTEADREHIESLMKPVSEPGAMASWLAAPSSGIHRQPVDFEYVRA